MQQKSIWFLAMLLALYSTECLAQRGGRWVGGGLGRVRGVGGVYVGTGAYNWGWGGYYGNSSTPYSNAVRSQAELTIAQGQAAANYAEASAANEKARAQYLENQARFQEMRRQQKAASEAKKRERKEAAEARAALRPPMKSRTELYPRLAEDQLDPLTGEIHWPKEFLDSDFVEDRSTIEDALKLQAESGPDDRTSRIIYDAAGRMIKTLSKRVRQMDSQTYSSYRKFLSSLSLEGEHAAEALE